MQKKCPQVEIYRSCVWRESDDSDISVDGKMLSTISEHCRLLQEDGFIEYEYSETDTARGAIKRITASGHLELKRLRHKDALTNPNGFYPGFTDSLVKDKLS